MSTPHEYEAPTRAEQPPTSNQDFDYPTDADKATANEFDEPDWSEANPIPVYIVERPEIPQILDWSSDRATIVDTESDQIAGARTNRTRIVVRNEGPDPIFIDRGPETMPAFSSRLAANEREEMFHNGAVWARCDTGKTAVVSVIQEFTVELDKRRD